MSLRERIAAAGATILAGAAGLALVLAPAGGRGPIARVELSSARGELRIVNADAGTAVLHARNLGPGARVAGAVQIETRGADARVSLAVAGLADQPGAGACRLSEAVRMRLLVRMDDRWAEIESGTLAGFGRAQLGRRRDGTARRYRVEARVAPAEADRATEGGGCQGARTRFDLVWRAVAVS